VRRRRSASRTLGAFCLGAKSTVLERAPRAFREMDSHVQFAGVHHVRFAADNQPALAARIAARRPDILPVAMTSPGKEQFRACSSPTRDVPACHAGGRSPDVVASELRRAPVTWQRLGVQWLYRLKQEPRRLWKRYLVTNALFAGMLLVEWARPTATGSSPHLR
jgi:N-acetylglucosaminyldiphosphoundecaprenol N-acetyl-beta-D-mannosaminyltransferase